MSSVDNNGYQETVLGWIPKNWKASTIGDEVESIVGGGTPSKDEPKYWNGNIPWASVKDFTGSRLSKTKDYISIEAIQKSSARLIPAGTLVTPTRMALGKVAFFSCDVAINQDLKALFPKASLLNEFLFYWFQGNAEKIEAAGTGSTVKGVRLETLRGFGLALPPFSEQQKIAAILNTLDAKLNVVAHQIVTTQSLKRGLIQILFSRGIGTEEIEGRWVAHKSNSRTSNTTNLPPLWKLTPFGEIAPIIRRPVEIEAHAFYPELGMRSFGKGTFHKPAISGNEIGNKRLFKICAGDLMFSNVFAWEGSVAIAKREDDGRYGSHRYITCKVDNTRANTHFLYRYITTPAGIEQLKLASPGGAGRNRTLGLSALAAIQVPLPPLDEQNKITEILDSVDAKLDLLSTKQNHYQTLKRGLMQKLLTGEWRVKIDDVS